MMPRNIKPTYNKIEVVENLALNPSSHVNPFTASLRAALTIIFHQAHFLGGRQGEDEI
jgi:hypothetical protein